MTCGRTIRNFGLRRRFRPGFCGTAAAVALLISAFAAAPAVAQPAPVTPAPAAAAPAAAASSAPTPPAPAAPAPTPLKTTVTATVADGYARLVFTAKEYIDGSARLAGNVLIISFKQPLDITVDRMAEQASDYVGAARRDPDGTAVRIALAQTVTLHTMSAGEKFFVDLLPGNWTSLPPGLPQDVVDEL